MKKPSRKSREYFLTTHQSDCPSWFLNAFRSLKEAREYKQKFLNDYVKIIKVREVRRGRK